MYFTPLRLPPWPCGLMHCAMNAVCVTPLLNIPVWIGHEPFKNVFIDLGGSMVIRSYSFYTINSHDFMKNGEKCANKTNEYQSHSPILDGLSQRMFRMLLVPFMGKIIIFGSSNELVSIGHVHKARQASFSFSH